METDREMRFEENRFNSFLQKWHCTSVEPKCMAACGFYHVPRRTSRSLQPDRTVRCAFCPLVVENWEEGDRPWEIHASLQPSCPFLRGTSDDVPLSQRFLLWNPAVLLRHPEHPEFRHYGARLRTFRDWSLLSPDGRCLAECGFFHNGRGDDVTCFYCDRSLNAWRTDDDPREEHENYSPHCAFVHFVKGRERCRRILETAESSSSSSSSPSDRLLLRDALDIFPKSLVEKVVSEHSRITGRRFRSSSSLCNAVLEFMERGDDDAADPPADPPVEETTTEDTILTCKVCFEERIRIVLDPCHHQVVCEKCVLNLSICPVCRSPIRKKIRVYWS